MILKKLTISLFLLCTISGCAQNAALIVPAITGASTGSVYQAGLSYGSGKVVKKVTGKTTTENIKNVLKIKTIKDIQKENYQEFFVATKILIDANSEMKDVANQ